MTPLPTQLKRKRDPRLEATRREMERERELARISIYRHSEAVIVHPHLKHIVISEAFVAEHSSENFKPKPLGHSLPATQIEARSKAKTMRKIHIRF